MSDPRPEEGDSDTVQDSLDPAEIELLCTLFNARRLGEAEALALTMTQRFPAFGFGWKILSVVLQEQGRLADALVASETTVALMPDDAEALSNLAAALQACAQLDRARTCLQRAIELDPGRAEAFNNLGNVLNQQGRFAEADDCYLKALQLKPTLADVISNRGANLQKMGRFDEAQACHWQALALMPAHARFLYNLGTSFEEQGQLNMAADYYQQSIDANGNLPDAHNNLGGILHRRSQLAQARGCFLASLRADPHFARAHSNLSLSLAYLSSFERVCEHSDVALSLLPDSPGVWEQRLYALTYHPDLTAAQIVNEFVRWGARFPEPVTDFSGHDRTAGRRLRIGYVSPDFRRHTSSFYFMPLFSHHDRDGFELVAYSNVKTEDEFTHQFKAVFDRWRPIRHLDDAAVARMVRNDGIDILVDCCNHMEANRLGVFTLKPAPIQVTWLGAAWTTGLKTIDYMLSDPYMAPEGTLSSETIVRLPHFFVAYQPPEQTAAIAPRPSQKNGFITFGYSGRTERLNHHTFRVWAEILRRIPDARLILDMAPFSDPPTQAHYNELMTAHGLDVSRVVMRKSANIFEGLNDIDILLDCFPHSGGTMLFDALWMGVPVLTLAGRAPLGLIGTSLMSNLGLPEWVARSKVEYIDKACAFAAQAQALTALRDGMRARMRSSPVMDSAGFARGVEAAYRQMYRDWTG